MKNLSAWLAVYLLLVVSCKNDNEAEIPEPLKVGYSLSINSFSLDTLKYARSADINFVEALGMNVFFDDQGNFVKNDEEVMKFMTNARNTADKAGIKIWSIHMSYSRYIDISTIDEEHRQRVVAQHVKLLEFLDILDPEIILFHPSYYLESPGHRDQRGNKMIKSAKELNKAVKAIDATMVIEKYAWS